MVAAARHLHHLPAQEAVLDEGGGEALVGASIPQLAVAIVAPTVQLPGLRVGCNKFIYTNIALRLMLSNMKLVNENTNKEMINLKMNCLRRGLSDFKVKQQNNREK